MANLRVDTIKNQDGSAGPTFDGDLEFDGTSYMVLPKGTTAQRPTGVAAGSLRFNTDTKLVEQYNGTSWVTLSSHAPGRGVFGGGFTTPGTRTNTIDYITIATTGNAAYFGDLLTGRSFFVACSSSTRGVFQGNVTQSLSLTYITIATTGNATTFGNMSVNRDVTSSCSSSTRGIFAGGGITPTRVNTIDYITIATTGNATDFGDLTVARQDFQGCSSSTRGIFGGGYISPVLYVVNTIDYITIATTGNATDFGDLVTARYSAGSCSSSTRGVFGGGYISAVAPASSQLNIIDYVTIASTGNAINFGGILTQARTFPGTCSNNSRGVFGGGYGQYTPIAPTYNIIDYITIASQGTNAQDFGDLTVARGAVAACSDAHGGLA